MARIVVRVRKERRSTSHRVALHYRGASYPRGGHGTCRNRCRRKEGQGVKPHLFEGQGRCRVEMRLDDFRKE
uniref:Uncharacterized protein n=1 Tax=Hyaloperonospora arabidopsidis (strain Emoy2) TaxID=559515 RepID=M4B210_HYAAE